MCAKYTSFISSVWRGPADFHFLNGGSHIPSQWCPPCSKTNCRNHFKTDFDHIYEALDTLKKLKESKYKVSHLRVVLYTCNTGHFTHCCFFSTAWSIIKQPRPLLRRKALNLLHSRKVQPSSRCQHLLLFALDSDNSQYRSLLRHLERKHEPFSVLGARSLVSLSPMASPLTLVSLLRSPTKTF